MAQDATQAGQNHSPPGAQFPSTTHPNSYQVSGAGGVSRPSTGASIIPKYGQPSTMSPSNPMGGLPQYNQAVTGQGASTFTQAPNYGTAAPGSMSHGTNTWGAPSGPGGRPTPARSLGQQLNAVAGGGFAGPTLVPVPGQRNPQAIAPSPSGGGAGGATYGK